LHNCARSDGEKLMNLPGKILGVEGGKPKILGINIMQAWEIPILVSN